MKGWDFFKFCETEIMHKEIKVILGMRHRQIEMYNEIQMLMHSDASLMDEIDALKSKNLLNQSEIRALGRENGFGVKND